ncbi:hypothetical protein TTHERM_00189350 (macronuclear) [Tetrahymena thermophila SB210]|uniref:Uncharacterized protein n=1 Tax=Tetrahymena thermophila (strain SB210) TaxID=312017 RepID=I7M804_TETTS|nr:hypothetical protein TTHERM_00189350 [Tetrahymena thermophila SB210]EAR96366.2 hypothetical protein TTHERM_00189350 [Tetrahymena thermophila SB210]|eukprot:XP_001016611.2 hypothetical protein TTHERM_00189350 [Tetrahymena thermophila SB210]
MIFSDRGRKKTNFFSKDPMSYSPDGKYIKHFEVPSPTQFKPYDGQKQYSLEKNQPGGLFFDQDSRRKEHDKMKQEYFDYCQYMMSLGKQPKSQQQFHNDIMNLAARPSTRDLKQAKQKFYAQELQRQIDEKNQQRFASQGDRNQANQKYIDVNKNNEVQVFDLQSASNQFLTPIKKIYGGSGDPIYDEYGNINANIRGISEQLHQGNSISFSPMRNNNKNVKGSRTTLGEGYFQEHKISNLKSQLKKQQQLQHQMEQEGKSIMDKMFDRQEERQLNRLQRHNEYMKDIERQMQNDINIFSNNLTQQDRMMKMANDYHYSQSDNKPQQKSIFQEMSDENQVRKMKRDMQLEQYNNDLQEQIELKKQQKKMQNEIDKIKEKKEEEKLQKEREDLRKQMENETKKRKKIIQDTDNENLKILEQQKKLQKNYQKLQEKQNHLINEAVEMQNKLKQNTSTQSRKMSQPLIEVPPLNSFESQQKWNQNQGNQSPIYQQSPQQNSIQSPKEIFPINSLQFNQLKQKPSQYPPISAVNPVQKLYENSQKLKEAQQNSQNEDLLNLRQELQNQTKKIQQDLQKMKEDMSNQQKETDKKQLNALQSQERLIVNEIAKIENQIKQQLEDQKKALQQQQQQQQQLSPSKINNQYEKKSRQSSKDFLKEAQDDMLKQLHEQQKQFLEEHKRRMREEKQKHDSETQKHTTEKMIQDLSVELQKKDFKEEMRYKILKNKIKDMDNAQNSNALFLKTALATMQQTPRTQNEEFGNRQAKHNLTYHEGDNDFRNFPILEQHFHHNPKDQQNYYTHRSQQSPQSPGLSYNDGNKTERKEKQGIITQHFHYDQFQTPRRPLSSQQGKKHSIKQNSMINSSIQTYPINYQDSGFQVDSKMFVKELQPLPEPVCRKKRSCSRQNMAQSQLSYNGRPSTQIYLPQMKRRESLDLGQYDNIKNKINRTKYQNQNFDQSYPNTLSYIDQWNQKQIKQQNNPIDSNNLANQTMSDYLNNTLLQSQPQYNNKDQYSNKKYPHSQYQSTNQNNPKLRSSSLLTERDQQQTEPNPNTLLENSNLINQNLDILDAIVKASNHNRTKSSQKRSVNRYYALKQKELEKEQELSQNLYSPYEGESPETGLDLYSNKSQSPYLPQFRNSQNSTQVRTTPWNNKSLRQSPQDSKLGSAERVIDKLDGVLKDIKSGNLLSKKDEM